MHSPHLSRKARFSLIGLAIAAAGLWALAIAGMWWVSEDAEALLRCSAITATVSLVVWTAALNVRDRHAALVLRCLATATRPASDQRKTVPLQVVRELPRQARDGWPR